MYRLFPLFVIFLFFSLIFSFVVNLTTIKQHNDELEDRNILKIDSFPEKKLQFVDILDKNVSEKQSSNSLDQRKFIDLDEIKMQKKEKVDTNIIDLQKYTVQFGVFSKKNGAEKLKNKLDSEIKKKYEDFKSDLTFNDKKKQYFLIYETKVKIDALNICNYSKELKIDCYVRKK